MSDQPQSLAELCSICYTEKPKYRCPRCRTQTCSLSCYKRHQQRASCNGQRDPAAYLKRSEWATPSGIDRDYNYLKSVERHVDRTGQDARERGITASHQGRAGERGAAGNRKVSKAWVPGSALQKYLSDNDIRVEKAPTGMSRQKANLTRVTNKGNVMWTVEWVAKDGKKSVDNENPEGSRVRDLWAEVTAKRLNVEKGKKRKREGEKQTAAPHPTLQESEQPSSTETQKQDSVRVGDQPTITDRPSTSPEHHTDHNQVQRTEVSMPKEATGGQPSEISTPQNQSKDGSEEGNQTANAPEPEFFYLRRPFTASKSVVLTPIDPSKTLTECLKGQTLLEFPTIFILPDEPHSLPTGFMLTGQYDKVQKAEEAEVDSLVQETNQSTVGASRASREEEKPLDANSILDMLKRDVGI